MDPTMLPLEASIKVKKLLHLEKNNSKLCMENSLNIYKMLSLTYNMLRNMLLMNIKKIWFNNILIIIKLDQSIPIKILKDLGLKIKDLS
jgi:hypothetical protein